MKRGERGEFSKARHGKLGVGGWGGGKRVIALLDNRHKLFEGNIQNIQMVWGDTGMVMTPPKVK